MAAFSRFVSLYDGTRCLPSTLDGFPFTLCRLPCAVCCVLCPVSFTNHWRDLFYQEHYGALLVGRPGEAECPRSLEVTNCDFTRCTVSVGNGAGGSMAIFDTSAEVVGCTFEQSQGTAVFFQSSDANTYQLEVSDARHAGQRDWIKRIRTTVLSLMDFLKRPSSLAA